MKSKTVLVTSLAAATFGLVSLVDTAGVLPFSAQTVQADTQTVNPSAKYYILVPKDSEVFKNWRGTANRPIIWATKTTPELSYFEETARNYIALENKSGANYIEWKGTVEEFKEAVKKLTGKTTAASTPKTSNQSTTSQKDGWSGSSYYQNGSKVVSKWIFDKDYNSYFYLDASGNYVQNAWEGAYYLKSGGYMAKSEWIYDGNYKSYYYLTSEGSYARNAWAGSYYLKSDGKMAKGEWIYDSNYSSYYYLTSEGSYAHGTWVGDYYLKSNGKMAVNERTPDGYQVDESGKWVR
ncbi:N-acetylmuramoyl-L-alanine amidase family protein [uncultured Streptococcus sp.]|uniref:N-acetylmuramoyl-L-alanine amidase family protein n=1 Tax=uncultured Streptococcus sp. TaxID=83427 RepID=UPI003211C250